MGSGALVPSLILASLLSVPARAAAVEDFTLLSHEGESHSLYRESDASAIVLVSALKGSPELESTFATLLRLIHRYEPAGTRFWLIDAEGTGDRGAVAGALASLKERLPSSIPVLMDDAQIIAQSLGFKRSSEAAVILPHSNWELAYLGPVDPSAIESAIAGEKPRAPSPSRGKEIPYADSSPLEYVRDIAPILVSKCFSCHRPGLYAPENLYAYQSLTGWSAMVREVVRKKIMPPRGGNDSYYSKFSPDFQLSAAETRKLVRWIETGMNRGVGPVPRALADEAEPPKEAVPENEAPDQVLKVGRNVTVPAEGLRHNLYEPIGKPFPKDVWIRKLRWSSDNPGILHHVSVLAFPPEVLGKATSQRSIGTMILEDERAVKVVLAVPGRKRLLEMPRGTALHLKKGSRLFLELHYEGTGKTEKERSALELFFDPGREKSREFKTWVLRTQQIRIPPAARNHKVETQPFVLNQPLELYSIFGHMHNRGKAYRFYAILPDGTRRTLLSVPEFDFSWQSSFHFTEPETLPAGTRLVGQCAYDNSAGNPLNPDPEAVVRWGHKIRTKEMCNFGITFANTAPGNFFRPAKAQ